MPPNIVWVNCDQLRWDAVGYSNQHVSAPPGGIDILPTLLDLVGAPVPERIDGRSFPFKII